MKYILVRNFTPHNLKSCLDVFAKNAEQTSLFSRTTCIRRKSTKYKWSYVSGPSERPLLGLTIGGIVDRAAELFGDNEALISRHQNIRKTFAQVKEEASKLAAGFLAVGFKPGDRLGIWGPNSYEWYLTEFAAAKAGLILVNINPSYRPNELKHCLNKVSVHGIVCADKFKTSNYYELLNEITPELRTSSPGQMKSKEVPSLTTVITMSETPLSGTFSFKSVADAGGNNESKEIERLETKIQFDDPCNIQFTSGSTGLPKAALLSHHNLVNNAYFVGGRCRYDEKPLNILIPVPLYHCFGCVIGALGSAIFGCVAVFPNAGFDPPEIVKSFEDYKINSCYGTPTMFVDILKELRKNPVNIESLSCGIMAGAPCPEELVNAVINELNMKDFIVMYGMTETSPVSLQCFPTDSPTVRTTTLGFPVDHTEVKVVDKDSRVVPVGEDGELWVRGYCNFLGYWGDEIKTAEIIGRDRWLKTGDLVTINEDGYGAIKGRIKDTIIRGGENIYPAEVENFYMSHPDIIEAQVFGVPDDRMGEEAIMWVRISPGSSLNVESLKKWSEGKIAHYKVPKYVLEKDEFPVTVTGKIQKFKMKEETIKKLGLPVKNRVSLKSGNQGEQCHRKD